MVKGLHNFGRLGDLGADRAVGGELSGRVLVSSARYAVGIPGEEERVNTRDGVRMEICYFS